jgi:hypothetical protein
VARRDSVLVARSMNLSGGTLREALLGLGRFWSCTAQPSPDGENQSGEALTRWMPLRARAGLGQRRAALSRTGCRGGEPFGAAHVGGEPVAFDHRWNHGSTPVGLGRPGRCADGLGESPGAWVHSSRGAHRGPSTVWRRGCQFGNSPEFATSCPEPQASERLRCARMIRAMARSKRPKRIPHLQGRRCRRRRNGRCSSGDRHTREQQLSPASQAVLQAPQCLLSFLRFLQTFAPLHLVKPDLQRHLPRFPPLQRAQSQQSLFLSHFLPTFLQARASRGSAAVTASRTIALPIARRRSNPPASVLASVSKRDSFMERPHYG